MGMTTQDESAKNRLDVLANHDQPFLIRVRG